MIPLRIIHVLQPEQTIRWRAGAAALLEWQVAAGHAAACLAIGEGGALPGTYLLGRRSGGWAWWRRERRLAVRAGADWIADLIHAHGYACLPAALDLGRRLAMPVVAEVDAGADLLTARILRDQRVACTIVPSESLRADLLGRIRLDRDRVATVPSGADLQRAPMPRHADGALAVGGWSFPGDRQGVQRFCTAIAVLRREGLAVSGLLAHPDPGMLAGIAGACGCGDAVRACADADLVAASDLVLALSEREHPLPPLVEALAAGRPVVAGALGGIPEIVRDGRCGILVPPADVPAAAAALRQLADAERRAAFSAAALETARRHDIQLVGEAVLAVYREAIGGPAGEASNTWKRLTTTRLKPPLQRLDSGPSGTSSGQP